MFRDEPLCWGKNVTYIFKDGTELFSRVSFSLGHRKCGLVGRNGSGKSTLLKLILGQILPSEGEIVVKGKLGYLSQDLPDLSLSISHYLGVDSILSVLDQLNHGSSDPALFEVLEGNWDIQERIEKVLSQLNLSSNRIGSPLSTLSGGQLTRLSIARLEVLNPKILLLDEPTNYLDQPSRREFNHWLSTTKGGVLVASHDRELLETMDQIWELTPQGLRIFEGGFKSFQAALEKEEEAIEHRVRDALREVKRVRNQAQMVLHRQEKRAGRAEGSAFKKGMPKVMGGTMKRRAEGASAKLKQKHEKKVQVAVGQLEEAKNRQRDEFRLFFDFQEEKVPRSKCLWECDGLNFSGLDNPGAYLWKQPITRFIVGPKRIGITGRNGVGKTSLLKLIGQQKIPFSIHGKHRSNAEKVIYLGQGLQCPKFEGSLVEFVQERHPNSSVQEIRTLLGRLSFEQSRSLKKMEELSGGERVRLLMVELALAAQPVDLLVLDEPTHHLDWESVKVLEETLVHFKGALVVVSHDSTFLEAIQLDEVWFMSDEGLQDGS